jgi:hypothetical protein
LLLGFGVGLEEGGLVGLLLGFVVIGLIVSLRLMGYIGPSVGWFDNCSNGTDVVCKVGLFVGTEVGDTDVGFYVS